MVCRLVEAAVQAQGAAAGGGGVQNRFPEGGFIDVMRAGESGEHAANPEQVQGVAVQIRVAAQGRGQGVAVAGE